MELTEDTVQNMVVDLRSRALEVIEESPPDTFHPLDIQRIKTDDYYVKRFLIHHLFDPELAFNMLIDCLKWRKEYGVYDITADSFVGQFFEAGAVYPFTHDKEGHQILMFHVKMHTKEPDLLPDKKRFLVYWFEKLDRESNGQQLTILFDMSDTGLSNMDMDFVKFVISLLKLYYPNTLAYLLVYELPWILSAAWKLVKTWLSTRAVEKIKFVSRQTILDYIDEDQLPISMGGTSTFQYQYTTGSSDSIYSQDQNEATPKKKVHFAEEDSSKFDDKSGGDFLSSKPSSVCSDVDMRLQSDCRNDSTPIAKLLRIYPPDELVFKSENENDSSGVLKLISNTNHTVAFKVKTTSPEKYRVRPSSGIIRPGNQSEILVHLQPGYQNSSLARDKFLIMAMDIESDSVGNHELAEIWRSCPKDKIMEHKLRCATSLPSSYTRDELRYMPIRGTAGCAGCGQQNRREEVLLAMMTQIRQDIRFLQRMVLTILVLMFLMLAIGFLMAKYDIAPFKFQKYNVNHCYTPFGA